MIENSYRNLAEIVFSKVFALHDIDRTKKSAQAQEQSQLDAAGIEDFGRGVKPLLYFLLFLGVPVHFNDLHSRRFSMTNGELASKVFLSMIGWNKEDKLIRNLGRAFVLILLNVVRIPLSLALNTIRFFTEYLPFTFSMLADEKAKRLLNGDESKVAYFVGKMLEGLSYLLYGIMVFGRAVTAPADSVLAAWNYGQEHHSTVLSWLLIASSVLVTTAAYLILLPIGIKMAVLNLPQLVSLVSESSFLLAVGHYIGLAFNPVWQFLGMSLSNASVFVTAIGVALASMVVGVKALYDDYHYTSAGHNPTVKHQNDRGFYSPVKPTDEAVKIVYQEPSSAFNNVLSKISKAEFIPERDNSKVQAKTALKQVNELSEFTNQDQAVTTLKT